MLGGTTPEKTNRLLTFVGFGHPVMHRQLSFSAGSSFVAWEYLSHTGQAYSTVLLHRTSDVAQRVEG